MHKIFKYILLYMSLNIFSERKDNYKRSKRHREGRIVHGALRTGGRSEEEEQEPQGADCCW